MSHKKVCFSAGVQVSPVCYNEGTNTNFNSFLCNASTQTVNEYFTANVATQTECQSDATDQVFQKESVGVQVDEFTYPKKNMFLCM